MVYSNSSYWCWLVFEITNVLDKIYDEVIRICLIYKGKTLLDCLIDVLYTCRHRSNVWYHFCFVLDHCHINLYSIRFCSLLITGIGPGDTCAVHQCVTHASCNTTSSLNKCQCNAGYTATPTGKPTMCKFKLICNVTVTLVISIFICLWPVIHHYFQGSIIQVFKRIVSNISRRLKTTRQLGE